MIQVLWRTQRVQRKEFGYSDLNSTVCTGGVKRSVHAEREIPKSTTTTTTARRLVNLEEFDLEFEGGVRRYHWGETTRAICLGKL